jgi:hypothetical protein
MMKMGNERQNQKKVQRDDQHDIVRYTLFRRPAYHIELRKSRVVVSTSVNRALFSCERSSTY